MVSSMIVRITVDIIYNDRLNSKQKISKIHKLFKERSNHVRLDASTGRYYESDVVGIVHGI